MGYRAANHPLHATVTMYTTYFGFQEKPFTLTPNPRFIYLSRHHREAFAHLLYGINNHYGFIELIGEVGTGKTTVLRALMEQLQEKSYRTALIFHPCLTGLDLLASINQEYGIEASGSSTGDLLNALNRFLLAENSQGRTVVLVIDEAQNLQADVLEQLRLISNLETEDDKLIQIVLVGQPELGELLKQTNLRQLNQRIAVRYRLSPMTLDETSAYIRHRMQVAGETGGVHFTGQAIKWVYRYSRGVPRTTNILCDRLLLIAYGNGCRTITAFTALQGILELLNLGRRTLLFRLAAVAGGLCLSLVLGYLLVGGLMRFSKGQKEDQTAPAVQPATAQPSLPAIPLAQMKQELLSRDQAFAHVAAFNAVAEAWGARPLKDLPEHTSFPEMLRRAARKRNLEITVYKGRLEEVTRLDLPFLFSTRVRGKWGNYVLATTAYDNGVYRISSPLFGRDRIGKAELETLSSGTYYLLWKQSSKLPERVSADSSRSEVRTLQRLLTAAGFPAGPTDGIFREETVNALQAFQRSVGLPGSRSAGQMTLAALSRHDDTLTLPSLTGRKNR